MYKEVKNQSGQDGAADRRTHVNINKLSHQHCEDHMKSNTAVTLYFNRSVSDIQTHQQMHVS